MFSARSLPPGFIEPCLPTASDRCKSGSEWLHEIKHDGYRLIARRTGDRVRLYTRRGYVWTNRYPRIIDALQSLRVYSVTIDGEAIVRDRDGKSDFDKLHSRGYDEHVLLYAFDLIEPNGEDLRRLPLEQRKGKLEKLLARGDGIAFSGHIEGDGATILDHACKLGLEGIVSSGGTCPIVPAEANSGSRSKIPQAPLCCELRKERGEHVRYRPS